MKAFLTGVSGYVGGSVANALLAHGHNVIGLVRTEEKAKQLVVLGIEPVIGSLMDFELLKKHAAGADGVINAADADNRPALEAMIAALRGSSKPFIHTSGSGIVADCAGGEATDKIYEDETPVHPLPLRVGRVALNDTALSASKHSVRVAIIAPSMVYGRGTGIQPNSIQIPRMIKVAQKYGVAKYIGAGRNSWSNVHIADLAALYVKAFVKAPAGAFYYAGTGENSMLQICEAISRMLGFGGKTASMSIEEAIAEYGEVPAKYSFGSNSRIRAVRAERELGWTRMHSTLLEDIERGSYARDFGPKA